MRALLSLLLFTLAACSGPSDVHDTRFMMGTLVEFTVAGSDVAASGSDRVAEAITEAAGEMQRIEDEFTIYGDGINAVKRFNHTPANNPLELPEEVDRLLGTALQVQLESGGAFSPALGGLNLLWGFSLPEPANTPPDAALIADAIPPSQCFVKKDHNWLRRDARCLLDFGGIAKGYAIDRGIAVLRKHHINNAIINAGGDIRLIGNHNGKAWKIGIRHPRKATEVIASLQLEGDVSIVTSGDYERFFLLDGKRFHHLLDPASGWPAELSQSATVIAKNATLADAWSTALFVLGEKAGPLVANRQMQALVVNGSGETVISTLGQSPALLGQ